MISNDQTVQVNAAQLPKKKREPGEPHIVPLERYRGIVTASRLLDGAMESDGSAGSASPVEEDKLLSEFKKKTKRATRDDKIKPKYEIEVAYIGKRGETKLKRVQCGVFGSIDRGTCTFEYTKQQADHGARMLACRAEFDRDLFNKAGGILNPNFWAFNLDWCDAEKCSTFNDRLLLTDGILRHYGTGGTISNA